MFVKPVPRCRRGRLPKPRLNLRRDHGFHGACGTQPRSRHGSQGDTAGRADYSFFPQAAFPVPRSFGCRPFFFRYSSSLLLLASR